AIPSLAVKFCPIGLNPWSTLIDTHVHSKMFKALYWYDKNCRSSNVYLYREWNIRICRSSHRCYRSYKLIPYFTTVADDLKYFMYSFIFNPDQKCCIARSQKSACTCQFCSTKSILDQSIR